MSTPDSSMPCPFFSVVIPTFNRKALLKEALDSVFAQTFKDYEVIVIDDGSSDGTLEMLDGYGDRVRVVQQANAGPGPARNLGIKNAHGQYIAFLDSDDVWFPWALETHRNLIETYDPSFISGFAIPFADIEELRQPPRAPLKAELYQDLLDACRGVFAVGGTPGIVLKTELLRTTGFADRRFNAEDQDLWMRLATAPRFVRIFEPPVYANRGHVGRVSQQFRRTFEGTVFMINEENEGRYPGGPARKARRVDILARFIRPVVLECLKRNERSDAWMLYRQSFWWHVRLARLQFLAGFLLLAIKTKVWPARERTS